ncbi:hypothetical protein V9T40_003070 [Parthenolecanium corni]|uniref:Apple domain-containing protein n=1 Tax=Parthenolecanium corni TaxID=536013 RepID=A0AAN9TRV3_9HEMI
MNLIARSEKYTYMNNTKEPNKSLSLLVNEANGMGALTKSQFPVFTIYAQKTCLGIKPCEKAWCFDRVQGYRLNGYVKKKVTATSRQDCLEMCLGEREFACRRCVSFRSLKVIKEDEKPAERRKCAKNI